MRGLRTFAVAGFSSLVALLSLMVVVEGAGPASKKRSIDTSVNRIDDALDAQWKDAGVTPAADADDAAFLRRATLDLAGRIPSRDEAAAFAADTSKHKRTELVDRLLASDDYAEHWADIYMDTLVGRSSRTKRRFADAPRAYFVDAFTTNKPADAMATELITATGDRTFDGATGYTYAHGSRGGSIEQLAGTTARVFLGTQIQCAQCHDHPYDERYEKEDFASFAAFFAEIRVQGFDDPLFGRTSELIDGDAARGIYGSVTPAFLGTEIEPEADETRRDTLARAITDSELFSLVTVNRVWAQMFGAPIHAPVDDLGSAKDHELPELLEKLAEDFRRHDYDNRRLLKVIALTRAYGVAASGGTGDTDDLTSNFAQSTVRPLSADQLFRSQLIATGIEGAMIDRVGQERTANQKEKVLTEYLFTYGDEEGAAVDTFTGNIPQILLLRNGRVTNQGVRARGGAVLETILADAEDTDERIIALFVATYTREPTPNELERYVDYIDGRDDDDVEAFEDLFHALLTSTEFMTNH